MLATFLAISLSLLVSAPPVRAGSEVLPPPPLPARLEAGAIDGPEGAGIPTPASALSTAGEPAAGDEEDGSDLAGIVDSLPPELMEPISPEVTGPEALAFYPDNELLVNPFGRTTELACEGLMQWLAPRGDGSRWHSGLDLVPQGGRARGSKLYAPGDGFVLKVADGHPQWGSYLLAVFRMGDHLYLTGWFHMQRRSHSHLEVRDPATDRRGLVRRGDFLGRVGATGSARGAHLHLDVVELEELVTPDMVPKILWRGRDWSEFRHPGRIISGLPQATYGDRTRPERGEMTRTRLPDQT